ncbi:MAG: toxin-antitoxin system YwqK family antitoxin [Flavobacteriales bacterium]|nr:toxin-antitoxin system YwqK family antitoxin [Flavobacteriales bacterium]
MKLFISIIFAFLSLNGFSQKRFNINDVNIINVSQDSTKNWMCFLKSDSSKVTGIVYRLNNKGKVVLENSYKNGLLHGVIKQWFNNGQLEFQMNFENGKQNGVSKSWFENGQICSIQNYLDGKLDGEFFGYYENGQPQAKGNRINFLLEGDLYNYHKNGQISIHTIYKKDQIITEEVWDEKGVKIK